MLVLLLMLSPPSDTSFLCALCRSPRSQNSQRYCEGVAELVLVSP